MSPPLSRDFTTLFIRHRQEHKRRRNRFGSSLLVETGQQSLLEYAQDVEIEMAPLPPQWVEVVDDANEDMARIKDHLSKLQKAQQTRLLRVFEDDPAPERQIEALTTAMSGYFRRCEQRIHQVGAFTILSANDQIIRQNTQRSLATQLASLSQQFRAVQRQYCSELRRRQTSLLDSSPSNFVDDFTNAQLLELEANEQSVETRSTEIQKIARSMMELQSIFKELAVLVIDQGTVLDRIDYNVEQVVVETRQANVQLERAYKSQRNSRSNKCILLLVAGILLQLILLVIKFS